MDQTYSEFWLAEFDKEVKRLFGDNVPENYSIENIDMDITLTPEEAAAHYFGAYHVL